MRAAFQAAGHNYGITLTLPSSFWHVIIFSITLYTCLLTYYRYMQHFDIVALEKEVDWLNMMTYDLHGTWDALAFGLEVNTLNILRF